MVPDPEPTDNFDAVAAAKELDDMLGESGASTADKDYIATLEGHIEDLTSLAAKKEALLQKANDRADQAHAEIEAAQKRVAAASAKELERRTRELLEGFLPVVDDLDRGIVAARKHTDSADVVEGLELVRRSMLAKMASLGVKHAPALGEVFDPARHEAIALVPVGDAAQDGRVIDVMREGYLIGDETLRFAGVAVGKASR
jgi:molecular chaperone GrpE